MLHFQFFCSSVLLSLVQSFCVILIAIFYFILGMVRDASDFWGLVRNNFTYTIYAVKGEDVKLAMRAGCELGWTVVFHAITAYFLYFFFNFIYYVMYY